MTTHFVPANTRSAIEIVKTDRERTTDEYDAFATFTNRISNLDVATDAPSTVEFQQPSAQLLTASSHASTAATSTEEVCDIYRKTIMDIDHYAEVYDDTLEESLAQEFGPEVATALITTDQLMPQLRDRLIECSQQARESRHSLLQGLTTEHGSLEAADEKLTRLGADLDRIVGTRSYENWIDTDLVSTSECLRSRRQECEQLLIERQTTLGEQRVPSTHRIDHEFSEYLYGSLSVTYPVISDTLNLIDTLRTASRVLTRHSPSANSTPTSNQPLLPTENVTASTNSKRNRGSATVLLR